MGHSTKSVELVSPNWYICDSVRLLDSVDPLRSHSHVCIRHVVTHKPSAGLYCEFTLSLPPLRIIKFTCRNFTLEEIEVAEL